MARRRRRLARAVALALSALALASCGGEDETLQSGGAQGDAPGTGGEMMSAVDVERTLRALRPIWACRTENRASGVGAATTRLIAIYREMPQDRFLWGGGTDIARPMDEVLEQSSRDLTACGRSAEAARIDRALEG